MFGISGFVALLQLIGMWTMPESPTWLKEQGRHEESEAAFRRINSEYVMFTELQERRPSRRLTPASYDAVEVQNAVERSASQSSFRAEVPPSSIIDFPSRCLHFVRQALFLLQQLKVFAHETVTQYRRQAYIALFLSVTQQFCGQTVVLSYAPTIFATAGGRNHASSSSYVRGWATLSIGLVKFVVTVLVIWKIELVGRRFLLLFGMATIAGGLLLLALAFGGTSSDETLDENRLGALFALPGVLLVVCGYSMSFGPLTWLLTSELFPTDIRGRALGASTIVTYLCAAVVTYTFLSAQEIVGPSVVFAFYLLVTCLGLVFAFAAIPDTKEKSVEEIEDDLGRMLWWKGVDRLSPQTGDASPLFGSATAENESSLNIPEAVLT